MPKSKKITGGRPTKNFDPSKSGHKAGSRSPNHRGYRADAVAPTGVGVKKQRWNAAERAARANHTESSRSSEAPREQRDHDRGYRGRDERPAYGERSHRAERPTYGDRAPRGDRPSYGDRAPRGDRPSYGNRPERSERPAYGDRAPRTDRPSYGDRAPRTDRPSYGDRAPRTDRPSYGDRAPRTDRPSYSDRDRSSRYGERDSRPAREYGDRPRYNRGEDRNRADGRTDSRPDRSYRPASRSGSADRNSAPSRDRRDERPARTDYSRRPEHGSDRRSHTEGYSRPERHDTARGSDFYPRHEEKAHFAPHEDVVLERLEADAIQAADVEGVTFGDLGLGDNICRQLASMGAPMPFPIQAATIPDVLAGKDVLGRGRTGSGKTIAFAAPVVERLMENNGGKGRKPGRSPRALIMAPTRELAMQLDRTVQPIARSVGLFTTTIFGGVPQYKQVSALQRGVDIVIATPGRLEDLIEQGRLDLSTVTITVIDEADHMCDLGFLEPVQRILRQTASHGQRLMFSATLDKGVATLVKEFLTDPVVHEVAGENQASSTIDHRVLLIEQRDKRAIIEELAHGEGRTLIFARTRAFAEQLADQLDDAGIPATSLHGDLNQSRRTRNLQLLTSGRVNVLVATDVAARGIHVDDISLVIQADAPDEYKSYLHRAGRTGRAGKPGTVVTLIPKGRRRRMDELLVRAEIEASITHAAPGDAILEELAAL